MFLRVVGREITLVAAWEKRMVADGSAMLDGLAMDRRIRGCDGRTKKRRGTAAELESTMKELSSDGIPRVRLKRSVWFGFLPTNGPTRQAMSPSFCFGLSAYGPISIIGRNSARQQLANH